MTVCISNEPSGEFDCVDPKGREYSIKMPDKYVCLPPGDARTLFEYCFERDE